MPYNHPFKVSRSMVLTIYIVVQPSPSSLLEHFSLPTKETLYPLAITLPPHTALGNQ